MKNKWDVAVWLALFLFCCGVAVPASAGVLKQASGLTGCETNDLASSSDGGLTLIGCSGPFGLYYSLDFGDSWTYATGGDYESGSGRGVDINSSKVFALVGTPGKIYYDVPSNLLAGTPHWHDVGVSTVSNFDVTDNFIVYGGYSGEVSVVSSASLQTVQSTTISGSPEIAQVFVDPSNGFAYVVGTIQRVGRLYQATFNASSGALGTWTDISANPGLPSNAKVGRVGLAGTQRLYVSAQPDNDFGTSLEYVSSDNGASFSSTTVTNFSNDVSFSADGSVGIIGNYVTTDSGATFESIFRSIVSQPQLQNTAVLIHPTDSERALVKTGLGVAKTTNLVTNSGDPTWTDVNTGLRSANVRFLSQISSLKDRVVVGLDTGVAYTENFSAASPTFKSFCPNGGCVSSAVALDPSDPTVVYAGRNAIYRGATSGGDITWETNELVDSPGAIYATSGLQVNPFNTSQLVVSYQIVTGEGGGLNFYNKSDGSPVSGLTPLTIPINAFIIINNSIIFAAGGASNEQSPSTSTRGIWKTADGGASWAKVSDSDFPSLLLVNSFSYDTANDVLYAVSSNTSTSGFGTGNGTLYALRDLLSKNATDWEPTPGTFPNADSGSDESFSAVTVNQDTGHVYVAAGRKIWASKNRGRSWIAFYTGLTSEDIRVLTFDALLSGGPGGLQGYNGEPPQCKGNKATLQNDLKKKTSKRNVIATIVGALSSQKASGEQITLQTTKGKTLASKVSNQKGKVSFKVSPKTKKFQLVGGGGQVLCRTK